MHRPKRSLHKCTSGDDTNCSVYLVYCSYEAVLLLDHELLKKRQVLKAGLSFLLFL